MFASFCMTQNNAAHTITTIHAVHPPALHDTEQRSPHNNNNSRCPSTSTTCHTEQRSPHNNNNSRCPSTSTAWRYYNHKFYCNYIKCHTIKFLKYGKIKKNVSWFRQTLFYSNLLSRQPHCTARVNVVRTLRVWESGRLYCVQLWAQQDISMGQKNVLCMETVLCAAVGTARHQHVLCMETVLCAAVGTASHQHGLETCTVYGDCTVCSCGHSKTSVWVRNMYCVWRLYCVQL